MMTKCLPLALLLVAAVSACSSTRQVDEQRAATDAANLAAAQALAAQAPADDEALGPWLGKERERVGAERTAATQGFADAEKACWRRFAVNRCVSAARTERRAALDRLRQEDLALTDVERRRRTEARLRGLEQKQQDAASKAAPR